MQHQVFQMLVVLIAVVVRCSVSLATKAAPASTQPSALKVWNKSIVTNHTSSPEVGNKSIQALKTGVLRKYKVGNFSKKIDAMAAQAQLSQIMASSQIKLAVAEKTQGKLVKKNRKELQHFIEENGIKISKAIRNYIDAIDQAAADLQEAVNISSTLLAQEDAHNKQDTPSWGGPAMAEKAEVASMISSAERELRRLDRHRSVALRQAGERAKDVLEGNMEHRLRSKLGDMTPLFSSSEKNIDTQLMYMDLGGPSVSGKNQNLTAAAKQKGQQARLESLEESLHMAIKTSKAAVAAAEKNFTRFLSNTSNQTDTRTTQVKKRIESAEQNEIKEIRGEKK